MEILFLGRTYDLVIAFPESASGDTVTYEIFNASGSVVQSGYMTFVRDEMWKVGAFTPGTTGTLVLKANNTTINQKRESIFDVRSSSESPADDVVAVPTLQEMLDNVNKAINSKLTGGAVQAYSISGRNIQHMTLTELRSLRKELQNEINNESGPARNYAKFDR